MLPHEEPPTEKGQVEATSRIPAGMLRNPLSLVGVVLITLSLANIVFLLLIAVFGPEDKPYLGIFAFMIFPAILIVGLILVPIGMLLRRRRWRRMAPEKISPYPKIDLNQPAQRRAFAYAIGFLLLMVVVSAVLSYRAYQFTDSITFCGAVCHAPMKPEYAAYQDSPHSRVPCV